MTYSQLNTWSDPRSWIGEPWSSRELPLGASERNCNSKINKPGAGEAPGKIILYEMRDEL